MKYSFTLLAFYGLATFRLAVLVSEDSGPWRAFAKFRSWLKREEKHSPALKKADAAKGVSCLRCSSVHLSIAVATYAYFHHRLENWVSVPCDILLSALALSALAILFNRIPKR